MATFRVHYADRSSPAFKDVEAETADQARASVKTRLPNVIILKVKVLKT